MPLQQEPNRFRYIDNGAALPTGSGVWVQDSQTLLQRLQLLKKWLERRVFLAIPAGELSESVACRSLQFVNDNRSVASASFLNISGDALTASKTLRNQP
ncbi:hypothetical protein SAMN05446635_2479 [Burkholderia sp. OK233]|nr:hypothetical protein SAMN05446635_2479 [Burkholderia sp. OK233]